MSTTALQTEIESRLGTTEPEVEVLLVEVSGRTLRLFIDHPRGVSLGLCEQVSSQLSDYRARYSLEVSSPGQDRPLTKPQHYTRFLGHHARVRLRDAAAEPDDAGAAQTGEAGGRAGRKPARSVTGELVGASEVDVTIAAGDGVMTIPYEQIARSNLVPGD